MNPIHLLTQQDIVSTRTFQSKFAQLVKSANDGKSYYNVVKNGTSVGVFLPHKTWTSLLEDLEAMQSNTYLESIHRARKQKGGKTLTRLKKKYASSSA